MQNKTDAATKKRVLAGAGVPSVEQILHLFCAITGREPTPEERAEIERQAHTLVRRSRE
jgi:hypothetical protein